MGVRNTDLDRYGAWARTYCATGLDLGSKLKRKDAVLSLALRDGDMLEASSQRPE